MDLAVTPESGSSAARRRRQSGMSLIEVMLASLLFLTISLGVVPMFTQSMVSNSSGNDSTKAANFARARAEEMLQLPFNHLDLTIEAGSEKTFQEYHERSTEVWRPFPIPDGTSVEWVRTTVIRQYNVEALEDDTVQIAEALPAGTDPSLVHLKEIEVQVEQLGGLLTSSAKRITVRTLRSH
ncbi:MAG TPA: prepilin-type N-terminal cleavage/methylation domain-containing protein [Thermoanaerobaculia bacterium]|nr:prepilin-type N-terminal cleavage/methylation domain-containing protein [Thermoanaerobaculia bacterium]